MTETLTAALPAPTPEVAIRMASALIHADEAFQADGHPFDRDAFYAALQADEVQAYLRELDALALLPVRRSHD